METKERGDHGVEQIENKTHQSRKGKGCKEEKAQAGGACAPSRSWEGGADWWEIRKHVCNRPAPALHLHAKAHFSSFLSHICDLPRNGRCISYSAYCISLLYFKYHYRSSACYCCVTLKRFESWKPA